MSGVMPQTNAKSIFASSNHRYENCCEITLNIVKSFLFVAQPASCTIFGCQNGATPSSPKGPTMLAKTLCAMKPKSTSVCGLCRVKTVPYLGNFTLPQALWYVTHVPIKH